MAIPKKAVKQLIEHCNKVGARTGRSGAQVFHGYLGLMKKYVAYFFSDLWPPKPVVRSFSLWLDDDEDEFFSESTSYKEEIERFTVILLKRNLCLEGFDAERFDSQFSFYGKLLCIGCAVPDAMYLREYFRKLEESNANIVEKHGLDPNDRFYGRLYEYRFSPESLRIEGMKRVELEFLEVYGDAEGRACEVRNRCLCPYGAKSRKLVELGDDVDGVWKLVEYYDEYWNGRQSYTPSSSEIEWYHVGEPGFLDVTSHEDILKAIEDGRMKRIDDERRKHEEACRQN